MQKLLTPSICGYIYVYIMLFIVHIRCCIVMIFSSPELAQGELLGYRDVRRPSYVWTSVTSETSETYETSETSVRQLFSLCTL